MCACQSIYTDLSCDDKIWNLFEGGMRRGLSLKRHLILVDGTEVPAPGQHLPQDQAAGVHVDSEKGVPGKVDGTLEHLGGHVAPSSNLNRRCQASMRSRRFLTSMHIWRNRVCLLFCLFVFLLAVICWHFYLSMCVSDNFVRFKLKSQPEIADTGSFVGPDQDILRLKERYANKLSQPQNKNKY